METVFATLVQITITTKVLALNFDDFLKNLPMPADVRNTIMDMRKKQHKQKVLPDINLKEFKATTPFIARKPYEKLKPISTVVTKIMRESYEPVYQTLSPRNCVLKKKTTVEPETTLPPEQQIPIAIPVPVPVYPSMPIVVPMTSFYEPVKHDHPPLHKIKEMIKEEENKWKEENGSDTDFSVEVAYSDINSEESTDSDTDTDTGTDDSEYNDVGHEYYDDVIKINARGRDLIE